jgi:hypothetical protein
MEFRVFLTNLLNGFLNNPQWNIRRRQHIDAVSDKSSDAVSSSDDSSKAVLDKLLDAVADRLSDVVSDKSSDAASEKLRSHFREIPTI